MLMNGKTIYTQTMQVWKTFKTEREAIEALQKFDDEYEEISTVRKKKDVKSNSKIKK